MGLLLLALASLLLPLARLQNAILGLALVLEFLSDGGIPALSPITEAPLETTLGIGGVPADLYQPRGGGPKPALILVHGLVEEGRRDTRLVQAARRLARSGFVVLVPDLPELRRGRLRYEDHEYVARAIRLLRHPPFGAPRLAVVGISVGAGPALFAAAETGGEVDLVVTLGAYAEAKALIQHLLGGGVDRELVRTFVLRNLDLFAVSDRSLLGQVLARSLDALEDPGLERHLTPSGRAAARLLTRRTPAEVAQALDALPEEVRAVLHTLSPVRVAGSLRARLLLIHGAADPAIPFTESQKLLAAASPLTGVRLVRLRLLGHVDPEGGHLRNAGLLAADVVDLWGAAYLLLSL